MKQPTAQEIEWAVAIRQAAMAHADIDADWLQDVELLQHAIVAKGNVHKALLRIRNMQAFKERYGIQLDGSYQEGIRAIRTGMALHAGFYLSVAEAALRMDDDDNDGDDEAVATTHIVTTHCMRLFAGNKVKKSNESWAVTMRGMFYIFQACQPNAACMRGGAILMCDGQGFGLWQSFSPLITEERMAALYANAYPMRVQRMIMMNANVWMLLLQLILQPFLPKKLGQVRVFERRSPLAFFNLVQQQQSSSSSSSPHYYNYSASVLPQAWGGTLTPEDLMQTLDQKLRERYEWAATFRLPKINNNNDDDDDSWSSISSSSSSSVSPGLYL